MSLEHAILGFLSFQSFSGYDLKKSFDQSVQHFWPANQSQIYRTLARMKDNGLINQEIIDREGRLDLKVYHITEKGRTELNRWSSTPLPPADFREPFLIQLYFGGNLSDDELVNVLQSKIKALEERLAQFHSAYQPYKRRLESHENPRAYFMSMLTMEFGLLNGITELKWLKSSLARALAGEYALQDFHLDGI